jgi:hypothetical protein
LCGYEAWSVILREEHRLRVFKNRLLRKVVVHKGKVLTRMGEQRNAYRILMRKYE